MIVDDENSLRMLVNATLEGEHCKILQAKNGLEAVEISRKERPQLIILDLMMPGMSGLEALEIIRNTEEIRETPVIILTAKGQPHDRETAMKKGASRFLTKPFSPLELLTLVEDALKGVKN